MRTDEILQRLKCVQKRNGYWMAKCPAHDDRIPSLKVTDDRGRKTLLICFAGCRAEDVLEAMGLTWGDLYNEND